jgi:hypothetical protein
MADNTNWLVCESFDLLMRDNFVLKVVDANDKKHYFDLGPDKIKLVKEALGVIAEAWPNAGWKFQIDGKGRATVFASAGTTVPAIAANQQSEVKP